VSWNVIPFFPVEAGVLTRTASILVAVLIAVAPSALCDDIILSFVSGECVVDVDGDGTWSVASVGMHLHTDSVIRTGRNGQAELSYGHDRIAIGSDTVIRLHTIADNLMARDSVGWFQRVSRRFIPMVSSPSDRTESATLGVRGDRQNEDDIVWMDEEGTGYTQREILRGKAQYEEGNYAQAISIFKRLKEGDQDFSPNGELSFYLGASLFNSVQYEEALPYLRQSIRDQDAHYREAALLYYSFSCYFTNQYDRAIDGFITYIEEFEESELLPHALLMLGKSYKAVGDSLYATTYFRDIEDHYSDTEVYEYAVQELRGYE
jgi:tetratricopeptide (TPR) repeat protein